MQPLGVSAADFTLPDVTQGEANVSLADFLQKPILIMFICNHCPFVIHLVDELSRLGNRFQEAGFGVVAISANDIENYPQDGPEKMREFALRYGFQFPYCYDESQSVARAYGAECTPDFFVYDADHKLRYRGQFDSSRPGKSEPVTGVDLASAMQALLDGGQITDHQVPSIGCNIKWKS